MTEWLIPIVAILLVLAFLAIAFVVFFSRIYRKVDQGKALIVNTMASEPDVTFTGRYVIPVFHRAEIMDISVKTIEIDRRGKEGLICRDNIRADIKVTFFVRVNKTKEDVLKVAQAIGCLRASDQETLEELFIAKFSEALKTVGKQLDFVDLYTKREDFKDQIIAVIGRDLNGYVLEDAAIDYLEQTPLESLDQNNILDAQGIRKITELTAKEHVQTNLFSNNEKKLIKKQDVETAEAVYELERQEADAKAKQEREIATVRARESAEIARVEAEEQRRAELARIKASEEVEVEEENKRRQVEVAQKNRERVIGVETERVEKDRQLEEIAREKAVELDRIAKEKALEVQRKEIQDVIRERVIVEKAVAVEEEAIKELRVVEEAKRTKEAAVIHAEAEAQEDLIKQIKAAEASEQSARFQAKQILVTAEAELEAADKQAQAKIRLAEGIQAESAAQGLAEARVKEADATATEKMGLAEARVKEADAVAHEKHGMADAKVRRELGEADADAIQARLSGEAKGLSEKADSMKKLDEAARGHEEFRLRIEKSKEVELAEIDARREVAHAQAQVLGKALESADIDIVGGDGAFLDKVVNSVSYAKSIDHFVDGSDAVKGLLAEYATGDRSLPQDVKDVLSRPAVEASDVRDLTVTALLAKLMSGADDERKEKLSELADRARELGLID